MSQGTLFIISAPSGAGKTSLVKALLERDPSLRLAVSYTTRKPRPGERDGIHYHFIDEPRFLQMVGQEAFLEHAEVFGNRYGTAEATVRQELAAGRDLLLEIDWQGARQIRERFARVVSLFVLPPSAAALEERLRGRGQDNEQIIAERMSQARSEMSHFREYDYLVVNEIFTDALDDLACLVRSERLRRERAESRLEPVLSALVRARVGT